VVIATAPAEPAGALILEPATVEASAPTRTLGPVLAPEPTLTQPARVYARCDQVELLTADLRRLHVTVSRQLMKKLDAAGDGLSHGVPGATTEQVIEAALDLLPEKQARSRGLVRRPRTSLPVPPTEEPGWAPPEWPSP
jgi:hypothetical protein